MKVLTFERGNESAALARVRAAAHAEARPPTFIGAAVEHLVPGSWNGQGRVPPGWTVPFAVEHEPRNGRVAIIAEDDFAAGKADFADAADKLPDDWDRSDAAAGKRP